MGTSEQSGSWSFAHVADMHIGSPRSFRFQPAWNDNWQTARSQLLALEPDFLLVGGDLTRDGSTHVEELHLVKDDLDGLPFEAHVIPGNHEVGNKYAPEAPMAVNSEFVARYASVFGASCWSFDHRGVRFSAFDAFLLGSGLPEEADLRRWLEEQRGRPAAGSGHVWMIHPALFAEAVDEPDFDRNAEAKAERVAWYFALDRSIREYLFRLFRDTGTTHVLTAHVHCRRVVNVDGIEVIFAPSTAFPQWANRWSDGDASLGFLYFTCTPTGITHEFVPLAAVSSRVGYGPGGNPPVDGRDYSVAWEKPPFNPG